MCVELSVKQRLVQVLMTQYRLAPNPAKAHSHLVSSMGLHGTIVCSERNQARVNHRAGGEQKAEVNEGESDLYSVKRQANADVVLPDSDRHNDAYECSLDFGVHGSADVKKNGRVASLNGCSCQFPIVFKLPCRHMFTVSIVCQRDVEFEFGVKYLVRRHVLVSIRAQVDRLQRGRLHSTFFFFFRA